MPRKYKTPKKSSGCLGLLIAFILAVILAFSLALHIYISMQPPIKNLKDFIEEVNLSDYEKSYKNFYCIQL